MRLLMRKLVRHTDTEVKKKRKNERQVEGNQTWAVEYDRRMDTSKHGFTPTRNSTEPGLTGPQGGALHASDTVSMRACFKQKIHGPRDR